MRIALATMVILSGLLAAASCEDKSLPRITAASHVAQDHPNRAQLWPILLQHCLRSPSCDPMGNFGEGGGQASGFAGAALYFVESRDVVREGAQDYGGRITLSLVGPRGDGGPAGRPLTLDEAPSDLRGPRQRQSWLSIEYRAPSGEPEPYFLAFRSAYLALKVPGLAAAKTQQAISDITGDYLAAMTWPASPGGPPGPSRSGARVEIAGKAGVLFTSYSIGLALGAKTSDADAVKRGFEPWSFYVSRNLRDDKAELAPLMKAIAAGETLTLTISAPDGLILRDAIYTKGFNDALKEATAALNDPHLVQPITDRCAPYVGKGKAIWAELDAPPAARVCDPRTAEERAAPPPGKSKLSDDEMRALRDRKAKADAEKEAAPAAKP